MREMNCLPMPLYDTVCGVDIGTSVFYAYVFERLRRDHPDAWVIAVSFKNGRAKQCAISKSDESLVHVLTQKAAKDAIEASDGSLREGEAGILPVRWLTNALDDGVSDRCLYVSGDVEWHWLSRDDACDVYMPLWTLDELRDAVQVLDLPIADHELDDRFDRCGGIPRPCLAQENEVVDRAMADCERAIASVTGPNQLVQVLCEAEEDDDGDACRYLLVHDEPSDDDPSWSVRRLASAYVSRRLLVKMAHSTEEERGVLRGLVDESTRLAWFRGWLTELEEYASRQ